jgi:hypothetical protein
MVTPSHPANAPRARSAQVHEVRRRDDYLVLGLQLSGGGR